MIKTDSIENSSFGLLKTKTKRNKNRFYTFEPPNHKFFQMFKVTTIKDEISKKNTNIYNRGYWNKSEHNKFIEALYHYNCDYSRIQINLKNRTYKQVCSHAQKFYLKLKTFKDEELGLNFTTPNVKSLKDIITIIKEKELNSRNCEKLLYIISEKLSFGKNPCKKKLKNSVNIKKEINLNNLEYKNENFNTNNYIHNTNNNIQINFQELLKYIYELNQQFFFNHKYDNLSTKNNIQSNNSNNNDYIY